MLEGIFNKNKANEESANEMNRKIVLIEIDQVATDIRNQLNLYERKANSTTKILEDFENTLEIIEGKIREIPTDSEEAIEKLKSKCSELDELYKKIKDLIAKN